MGKSSAAAKKADWLQSFGEYITARDRAIDTIHSLLGLVLGLKKASLDQETALTDMYRHDDRIPDIISESEFKAVDEDDFFNALDNEKVPSKVQSSDALQRLLAELDE